MWPSRSDMSRDECRKCLRCLELDAYGNMVSVLRAQGSFTEEKQKLLGELAKVLHISNERHRAEVRRAVNDDKLSVIAEQLNGPNSGTDWAIEGRRTIPLLPRLKAHTAFTGLANSLSLVIAAANEKKLPHPSRIEEPSVKAETSLHEDVERDERITVKLPTVHSEISSRGKKRKRSSPRSSDSEKCEKSTEMKLCDPEANSMSCKELRVDSPLPIEKSIVQVSIVTPSTTTEMTTINDNTHEFSAKQITSSSTNSSIHHEFTIEPPSATGSSGITNSSIQSTANDHSANPTNRQDSPIVDAINPLCAKNRTNVTATIHNNNRTSTKVQRTITAQCTSENSLQPEESKMLNGEESIVNECMEMDEETKISRPDSTTSNTPCPKRIMSTKLCITTQPIITSSTNCMMTVNSGSTASSGPGPPCVTPSTMLTYKKLPPGTLNHHSGTIKMGITVNSNKTLKVNAHPTARMATKANVIVVQKGSSRGVTLSHGGKEVRGKVIMGSKNTLCLANQKTANSLTLLPHRGGISNNGEQSLTTLNANHAESLKLGGKTGNMIVLDIRQDLLDKNKVLSQLLEASVALNNESKTVAALTSTNKTCSSITDNHTYDFSKFIVSKTPKSVTLVNSLKSKSSEKMEMEPSLYSNSENADSSDAKENSEILKRLTEEKIENHGVLDAQTGIYNYNLTADDAVIENHEVVDSIPTSGIDIFSTVLSAPDINLENFHYTDNEDDVIIAETCDETIHNPMTIVQHLEELDDS